MEVVCVLKDKYSILFFHMLLRKSRKHLHGASNRNLLHPAFTATFYKTATDHPKHNLTTDTLPATSYAHKRPRRQQPLRNSLDSSEPMQDRQGRLEQQLRKMYQGRRNIAKTIQGWGFDAKGFISSDDFGERVQEKMGVQVEEGEVQQLLRRYCRSSDKIDTKQLITLIHGRTEGNLFNQTLFPAQEVSKQRESKIINLKESLKAYQGAVRTDMDCTGIDRFLFKVNSSISKLNKQTDGLLPTQKEQFFSQLVELGKYGQHQKQALKRIAEVVDYQQVRYNIQSHISVDKLFLDPILRKTRPNHPNPPIPPKQEQPQKEELFVNKMVKSSTSLLRTLTTSQKRQDLDPRTLFHVNQQKTRFGMSKFTQQSEQKAFLPKENVTPNQKDLILQTIKSEADIHKQRYENKLAKLRILQQAEGENMARREQQAHQRDKRKLQRIRHEQQAYNYVNYIKKKWE